MSCVVETSPMQSDAIFQDVEESRASSAATVAMPGADEAGHQTSRSKHPPRELEPMLAALEKERAQLVQLAAATAAAEAEILASTSARGAPSQHTYSPARRDRDTAAISARSVLGQGARLLSRAERVVLKGEAAVKEHVSPAHGRKARSHPPLTRARSTKPLTCLRTHVIAHPATYLRTHTRSPRKPTNPPVQS
mmetsp:Transcript_14628/g.30916  ORF Transcript_14628/g.30916 Transcript_14628/m.30916 type:complete len:194 (-) Transcript_14628:202-783(-)|eukprot:6193089-Pleurochrysis_carterae.AAC.2